MVYSLACAGFRQQIQKHHLTEHLSELSYPVTINKNNPPPVALITGAARRIGAAIARMLHRNGYNIIIHYSSADNEAAQLADELNAARADSAHLEKMNLLDSAQLPALIASAAQRWQRLDALINNASSFYPTPVDEIKESDWENLVGTNLKAPLFLSQYAAPHLQATKGCIVNIVDIHAERPMRKHVVYSVAKAGLVALTKSLARELAPSVRVNAVAPGAILWPEQDMPASTKDSILQRVALQRPGEPDDIARTVNFLINDAPYITGQVIPVDGGRNLNI